MKVNQFMREDLCTVSPDAPLQTVLKLQAERSHDSRLTCVIEYDMTLLGVVTYHALLSRLAPAALVQELSGQGQPFEEERRLLLNFREVRRTPVREIMIQGYPSLSPEDGVLSACALFGDKAVTAVPVVDVRGLLLGEVTRRLLLRALAGRMLD
jgi:CBS domain-containing protein